VTRAETDTAQENAALPRFHRSAPSYGL